MRLYGSKTGSLPSKTSKKESCGTCLPITSRQTVKGVANRRPTGPHNQSQKTAATKIATGDTPVCFPYSHGAKTLPLISSSATNNPSVRIGAAQPGVASDNASGIAAAIQA